MDNFVHNAANKASEFLQYVVVKEAPSTKENTSKEEGGDMYLDSSITHAYHEAWLVDAGASFHMNPYREWFCDYERYDGVNVFL
jgi:hypothetical protein